ncbi:Epidermal retinol dehydrogenase 2 [Papilio xuthus]|uniref:Short-chain dehydrogenase/reductase 3 n=1 Tax=Papilio xuthus TaxID=66420 RepID=A0A194PPA6_PAPXU|nr:Epidermal retinol dehydrogenase 2 [Papilio xuthus]
MHKSHYKSSPRLLSQPRGNRPMICSLTSGQLPNVLRHKHDVQRSRDNSPLRLIRELLWTLLVVNFEILRAIFRWLFPAERKDVAGEVVLVIILNTRDRRAVEHANTGQRTIEFLSMCYMPPDEYTCDVTDRAAVLQLAEQVRRDAGDVNVLVNNAGIMPCKPITEQTEKEIRLMMDINVNANIWCIQAFLPAMIERNHGHIVALSSMAGLMGIRNLVPYCGSKFAARGIMEALAIEVREDPRDTSGIHFTTVCPYIVNTGLCHKPRIRFESAMKVVNAGEAADMIVDAVLRNVMEITIPPELHYMNRYIHRLLPFPAAAAFNDFFDTGVDAHD